MDKEFAEEFELELTEGKVEELGKQIAGIAGKLKGKEDVMTMADEMITNGTMPDPEMIKMLETEEGDIIRHLIAKKMGIQWTKDNGYGEMRFKQDYPESTDMVMKLLGKKKGNIQEDKDLEKIVKELEGASKMHLGQSKRIAKYLDIMKEGEVEEGIDIEKASMGDVIKDFKTSNAPQFKGKSDKKRKEMAIAAKLSREENEDDDPVGKKKKKSKKDVINLKPTAESSMKKLKDIMIKMKEKRSNNVDEAVNLKKLKKEYDRNEDKNHHTENYLLLAKAFGTPAEVKKVQEIMKRNEKQGSTSKADSDWMYKNINKYYDKIRNEEVEVEESDGYEVDLAAKKIQHKWKRMSKAEKVRFLDKMDVLAGKTKVSDSDLEDILSDYGLTMEATGDKEAYEKFFQSALKKFGVKSPAELKGDKKKEFFDYVDKNWTGDHEEQTNKEQTMTKKSLKDAVSGMKEKKTKVTEAMTIGGLEVGEQEFDKGARIDHVAPNLGMTYKDYQAKFETNGLEGPYQIDGGAYFWDKTVGKWFSVETEDYVDDKRNAELNFRYTKGGSAGGGLLYQRSYNN